MSQATTTLPLWGAKALAVPANPANRPGVTVGVGAAEADDWPGRGLVGIRVAGAFAAKPSFPVVEGDLVEVSSPMTPAAARLLARALLAAADLAEA